MEIIKIAGVNSVFFAVKSSGNNVSEDKLKSTTFPILFDELVRNS